MGVVYSAFDPKLDRRVAIKMLLRRPGDDAEGMARLTREAQAMARLAHPNVVTIHDVSDRDGVVFLAMEFIEGATIRAWAEASPRSWREIVGIFAAAGRGLAAAHGAGLVHRDFKPENVMVADDGRVLVMDFGLARVAGPDRDVSASDLHEERADLTVTGSLLGTPAYMSPEQFDNGSVDAPSDQFSFCVSLHELLFGERPFKATSILELAACVRAGRIIEPAKRGDVPRWLSALLERGMSVEPSDRFSSMGALLDTLDRGLRPNRTVYLAAGGVLAAGATAAAFGFTVTADSRACKRGEDKIEDVWNAGRNEQIGEAYAALETPFAAEVWTQSAPLVDAFAKSWADGYYEACVATNVDGGQSEERLDARMDCLAAQRTHLETLLQTFETPDFDVAQRTHSAVSGLPRPGACADPSKISNALDDTLPRDTRTAATEAGARTDALLSAGRYDEALDAAKIGLARLPDEGVYPLRAGLLQRRASAERRLGDLRLSEATLRDALAEAGRAHDNRAVAATGLDLIFLTGVEGDRAAEAEGMADIVEATVDSSGAEPDLILKLYDMRAILARNAAEWDRALEHHGKALTLVAGPEFGAADRSVIHGSHGKTLMEMDRFAPAREEFERAYEYAVEAFGPDHPIAATDLSDIGRVCRRMGDHECGMKYFQEALDIRARALGRNHPLYADAVYNFGLYQAEQMQLDDGESATNRAIEIWREVHGEQSSRVAIGYSQLANIAHSRGDNDKAEQLHARSLDIRIALHGEGHPSLTLPMGNRANALVDLERYAEAIQLYDETMAIQEASLVPDHLDVAYTLIGKCNALVATDRAAEAVPLAQRALDIRLKGSIDPYVVAVARFALARASWPANRESAAREEAKTAFVECHRSTNGDPKLCRQIEEWLVARDIEVPARPPVAVASD